MYNFKELSMEYLKFYEVLKQKAKNAYERKNYEKCLKYIFYASSFAWLVHFGKWCDDELEDLLKNIGYYLKKKLKPEVNPSINNPNKIAFLASFISDVGGHNTVLEQYAHLLKDKYKHQDLYITKHNKTSLFYPRLKKSLKKAGLNIFELPTNISYLSRIKTLIKLIQRRNPDILILFTHPNDVTIIPALISFSQKPLTIFFNHADHTYWLGKSIIDRVIEQRIDGVRFSRKYRRIQSDQYIIPLSKNIKPKKVSKLNYGIPENSSLSISIGGFTKVQKFGEYDYFNTIEQILRKFPNHYHMFITVPPSKEYLDKILPQDPDIRKRFIVTGPFSNLEPIYGIGDFLIDTFPIGGGMVIAGAMACKIPIVRIHNERFSILSDGGGQLPQEYQYVAANNEDLINLISSMIKNPKLREETGELVYEYYTKNLSPEIIKQRLIGVIDGNPDYKLNLDNQSLKLEKLTYDVSIGQKSFLTNRKYFLILDLKFSVFSIKERFNILFISLKMNEIRSSKELIIFTIIAIGGKFLTFLANLILKIRHFDKIFKNLIKKIAMLE